MAPIKSLFLFRELPDLPIAWHALNIEDGYSIVRRSERTMGGKNSKPFKEILIHASAEQPASKIVIAI